jgi:NitT/TauT family transport system ATP-binding protein
MTAGSRPHLGRAMAGAAQGGCAIQVTGLDHVFPGSGGEPVSVLEGIDLTVTAGQFVAIVGPSGCGKTTLLNLLSGLEPVQAGSIHVHDERPVAGDRDVGYLLARDALLPWRTVAANAELALELGGVKREERRRRALDLLSDVGLAQFADSLPAQLSHGMRQRVAIARTLAPAPRLLLLDEPFSALDAQTKLLLQDTFMRLCERLAPTVVLITHDLQEAIALADRVVLMTARPGRIKRAFDVDLPRPRSVLSLQGEAHFHELHQELWASLREEVVG